MVINHYFFDIIRNCQIVNGNNHIYKGQCLPEGYRPDLVKLSERASWLTTVQYMTPIAKDAIERMITDAEKDGMCLVVASGYRSQEEQGKLYLEDTTGMTAKSGESEHQTGLAADIVACPMRNGKRDDSVERLELKKPLKELPEYQWLLENASKYGFEQSFRVDNQNLTGYPDEDWHWKLIVK